MKRAVVIETLALLLLGAIGLAGGLVSYLNNDARAQSSSLRPGMYVLALSAALVATAFAYAFLALRKRPAEQGHGSAAGSAGSRMVSMVFGAMVVYALLITLIGYLPATILFLAAQFRLLGVESWRRNAALTALVSASFYVVFVHYGDMSFPHASLLE